MKSTPWAFLGASLTTLFLALPTARAGNATWTGATSDDWNVPTNWNPATVPNGSSDVATFDISNTTGIAIQTDIEVNEIHFRAGTNLYMITVGNSSVLTLSGAGITNTTQGMPTLVAAGIDVGGGEINFTNSATAGLCAIDVESNLTFSDLASAGEATITNARETDFADASTAATATITNNGAAGVDSTSGLLTFGGTATAGNAVITNNGSDTDIGVGTRTAFEQDSTAQNATLIANAGATNVLAGAIFFGAQATGGTAHLQLHGNGGLDISTHFDPGVSIDTLEEDGLVFLGGRTLGIGEGDGSSTFSGVIMNGGLTPGRDGTGSLTKLGSGVFTLNGIDTYTGPTTVEGGNLVVNGALSSEVTVENGGTLSGGGHVANLIAESGATVAPGNGVTLSPSGIYRQEAGATLALAVAGTQPGQGTQLTGGVNAELNSGAVLEVDFTGGFAPKAGEKIPLINTAHISGGFSTVHLTGVQAGFGYTIGTDANGIHLTATNTGVATTKAAPSNLLNISTRVDVQTGSDVLIGGFIIKGTAPKMVLVRGLGPSLKAMGVAGALSDPVLELHKPDGTVITNDNWVDAQKQAIIDTGIPPANPFESAIVATLDPGEYTCVVRGNDNATGVGLVEVYDLDRALGTTLANISTRGLVETGDNVMIGGFIAGGLNGGASTVVVRGLGPSLATEGITDSLADPTLALYDSEGNRVAENNDWMTGARAPAIIAEGLAPKNPRESAVQAILPPGAYTAILSGVGGATGVGLVEVYNLP
jgi:autotransporter-associated beta strand protein